MPLKQGKSKKAFQHNIKAEMHAGKPQKQALAIAYSIKRKNAKKKASGGAVESGSKDMNMADGGRVKDQSAASERRPMPENAENNSMQIRRNSGNKPPGQDSWTGRPTVEQAQRPSRQALKHPKMVPQSIYSVRLRDQEDDLEQSAKPGTYGEKPPKQDDEEGANRQGPKIHDMEDEHSTHRKPYAYGGYAKGGMIDDMKHASKHDMEPKDHDIQEREREDESDLMDMESPSEDEGRHDADSLNEEGPDRHGPDVMDMEEEHSTGRKPYAKGGSIQYHDAMDNEDDDMEMNPAHDKHSADDSEDQPDDEEDMEDSASIAAAIMAKERREDARHGMSESDMDDEMMMAHGGEILDESEEEPLSHDSIYSDDSDQADLSRNADEDANEEDQLSFNALRKENYSESDSLDDLDSPMDSAQHGDDEEHDSEDHHSRDVVSQIRRAMKRRSPISR